MTAPQLLYFADPLCSWCWGFSPTIDAIRTQFGEALPIHLVLGGLRPGTVEPMTPGMSATIREHWRHVAEASGQPFDFSFFDRAGFIYDTEPAARAVVAMRERDKGLVLPYFKRLQQAFYAENRDTTALEELAALAGEFDFPRPDFLAAMAADRTKNETLADFIMTQRTGITGFPTLLAGTGGQKGWALITEGFQPMARVLGLIDRWMSMTKQGGPAGGSV